MICNLDNKSPPLDDKGQPLTNVVISSELLINKFHGLEALAQAIGTNLKSGLDPADVNDERRAYFGVNFFKPPKIKTVWELVAENFDDKINIILLVAALVSVVIGLFKEGWPEGLIEGVSIMIALIIIIVVNSGNNWISER